MTIHPHFYAQNDTLRCFFSPLLPSPTSTHKRHREPTFSPPNTSSSEHVSSVCLGTSFALPLRARGLALLCSASASQPASRLPSHHFHFSPCCCGTPFNSLLPSHYPSLLRAVPDRLPTPTSRSLQSSLSLFLRLSLPLSRPILTSPSTLLCGHVFFVFVFVFGCDCPSSLPLPS